MAEQTAIDEHFDALVTDRASAMDAALIGAGADATRNPQLAGFMEKKGEHFRAAFKRRWFCLDGDELRWSETAGSAAKGSLRITAGFSARASNNPAATPGEIEIVTPSRTFRLRCDNADTAACWIQGLNQVVEQLCPSSGISEAVPPEETTETQLEELSYLSLVTASPRCEGTWPPTKPLPTSLEATQRRLAFGISLCANSQPTDAVVCAAECTLEHVDADVLDSIGQQLAILASVPHLEQALQAVGVAQETEIVGQHLTRFGTNLGVRNYMEMLGAMWMKEDNTKGAFKGKWKALVNDIATARGLMSRAEVGQLAVRRDADDDDWGIGYVTQISPVKVNAASAGRNSPGYEWVEVRTVMLSEGLEEEMSVGEQVIFRDDGVWQIGIIDQTEPDLRVSHSSTDLTSVPCSLCDVRKFPSANQRLENLFFELNSRMEVLPTTAALLRAAQLQDAPLIETILVNGADPDGVDHNAETALHILAGSDGAKQPQHYASVAALLHVGSSVDMKVKTTGQTALMRAAYRGYASMCVQLIRAGADMTVKDLHGQDAKHWALKDMPSCTQPAAREDSHRRSHIDESATKFVGAISYRTVGRGRRIYGQQEAPSTTDTDVLTIQPNGRLRKELHVAANVEDRLAAKRSAKEQCLQVLTGGKRTIELRARRRGLAAKLKMETKREAQMYLKGQIAEIKKELGMIRQREDEIMAAASTGPQEVEPEPEDELGPEPSSRPL